MEVRFHSELIGLDFSGERWQGVMACRGSRYAIDASVVVDASGDAEAAALIGAGNNRVAPARLQRRAYVFGVQGVAGE